MEESSTYRAIFRKGFEQGRIEGARRMALLTGKARFGPPSRAAQDAINAMSDLGELEELSIRIMSAGSWQELVPTARRRNGRRTT